MSQLVTLDDRAARLQQIFTLNMGAMAKMAPRTLGDPSRLIRIAYNSIAYDSALVEVTQTKEGLASIFGGVMEALKLGLTIGGPAQESWLIPFNVKGTKIATLIIGYQGFRNIIDRSKSVIDMHPRAVFANDEFDVDFGNNRVHHKPYWLVGASEPGPLIAVYCIAHLQRGGIQIEVMPHKEIEEHRQRSRAAESGPWKTDYTAMALKTVIRKMAKYLPKSSEILQRALELDTQADIGGNQNFDVEGLVFDGPATPAKQVGGTKLDALKNRLTAGRAEEPPGKMTLVEEPPQGEHDDKEDARVMQEAAKAAKAVQAETVAEPTPEEKQRQKELDEIERRIQKEQAKERAPHVAPAEIAQTRPTGEMTPLTQALFDTPPEINKPIGKDAAAKLLETIRKNAPKS